jgi:beta-lactamase class A
MLRLALAVLLFAPSALPQADSSLEKHLKKSVAQHQGRIGFVAKNLKTGQTVNLGGDEPVPTASTIKLLVYVEAFHQIQDLKKSLSDEITLQKEDQCPAPEFCNICVRRISSRSKMPCRS